MNKDLQRTLIGVTVLLLIVVGIVLYSGGSSDEEVESEMDAFDGGDREMMDDENFSGEMDGGMMPNDSEFGGEMGEPGEMGDRDMPTMEMDSEACEDLDEGDACETTNFDGDDVEGTCRDMGDELVCLVEMGDMRMR